MTVAAVEVADLFKVFGGIRAVARMTLRVEPGERRALIGPNGAGKTTLFRCLTGTLLPTSGSITLYGNDHYLIDNPSNRYSVGQTNVVRNADGTFVIRLSTVSEQGNWIATSPEGFDVTLRLYNPGETVKANPATAPLPSIVKEACT